MGKVIGADRVRILRGVDSCVVVRERSLLAESSTMTTAISTDQDALPTTTGLTEREAQIYDRQLRLWGVRTQSEMRKHKLLIYGVDGLCCEMVKNLVLAGIGSIYITDDANVTEADLASQFFVSQDDVGKNRAECSKARIQELNPLVSVEAKKMSIDDFDKEFLGQFNSVSLHGCTLSQQRRVAEACRELSMQFFSSETFGMYALCFQDLGPKFQYTLRDSPKAKVRYTTTYEVEYVSLLDVHDNTDWSKVNRLSSQWIGLTLLQYYRDEFGSYPTPASDMDQLKKFTTEFLQTHNLKEDSVSDEELSSFTKNAGWAINPVCAIVGGVLAQEVIKSLSRDASPMLNYFVFDAVESFSGFMEAIGVPEEKQVSKELISNANKDSNQGGSTA